MNPGELVNPRGALEGAESREEKPMWVLLRWVRFRERERAKPSREARVVPRVQVMPVRRTKSWGGGGSKKLQKVEEDRRRKREE